MTTLHGHVLTLPSNAWLHLQRKSVMYFYHSLGYSALKKCSMKVKWDNSEGCVVAVVGSSMGLGCAVRPQPRGSSCDTAGPWGWLGPPQICISTPEMCTQHPQNVHTSTLWVCSQLARGAAALPRAQVWICFVATGITIFCGQKHE